ncbi:MAG: malate/L-sulfolactate dehydrogenase [Caballeronia sp.]|jgi:delta1-piperideine-2-carboxylate reductase|uniref:Ldh family oxidoreductase n=1 Tax=Caballeronia sp. TaxID=1931223 RepID=UPI002614A8C2|nr:Ldh family oxidoreductase [Caballeronia sp.]MDB5836413.1 malate/L-sulfolactate dehydrogenase [Caballeronia sp.]
MENTVNLTLAELSELSIRVLTANGMAADHAQAIAEVIVAGQRDECQSHGIYRLIVCVNTLRNGKVVRNAKPDLIDVSPALVRVDARFGYSQLAFQIGSKVLVQKARQVGIAALAINNCFHFSALWPEVEYLAGEGLAALAMTPSHSWVAPAGGTKPLFGTNPIAFAWPRPGRFPYVFDFATSAIARGDIELHRRAGKTIPLDWAVDANGQPTDDPAAAMRGAMMTFGGYKGSALSAMVELLAGPLIGDLTSAESMAFDQGVGATPCHGELILAFNPSMFSSGNQDDDLQRAEALFNGIVDQGARLPSQRRFDARLRSEANGVEVPRQLLMDVLALIPS